MNKNFLSRLALIAAGVAVAFGIQVIVSHRASAQTTSISILQQQAATPVGGWYGQALPQNPATAPFPEVWMMPTFFADGNVIANDSHELNSPHTTGHGSWYYTAPNVIHAVFVWINFGPLGTPSGLGGAFRISLDGTMDPKDPDHMFVQIRPLAFAPNQNPLDITAKPVVDGGIFIAKALTRIRPSKF